MRTIMQNRYELVIYWSKDDQCFIVEVPELPGCMADGESHQDAVKKPGSLEIFGFDAAGI